VIANFVLQQSCFKRGRTFL